MENTFVCWSSSQALFEKVPAAGEHVFAEPKPCVFDLRWDGETVSDPQQVLEYITDIDRRLGLDEERDAESDAICPTYMKKQPEMNAHIRAVIIDWLIEVQLKYRLRTETLFLSANLFDRFLSTRKVRRTEAQLVMITAAFIAAKFEEIEPPDVRDFMYVTKQSCSKESILLMEVKMLTALEFCLARPTAVHFMERYCLASGCCETHCYLFQYILELGLLDLKMLAYSTSQQAAAALLLSGRLLSGSMDAGCDGVSVCVKVPAEIKKTAACTLQNMPDTVAPEVSLKSIERCMLDLYELLKRSEASSLQAVRRKFTRPDYQGIALRVRVMKHDA